MQYLRKKGFALINTMIIVSLLLVISSMMFKLIKNNMEMSSMYGIDDDIYSLGEDEEDIIYQFMSVLNEDAEKLNDSSTKETEEESKEKDAQYSRTEADYNILFAEDFQKEKDGNILEYKKNDDKLILKIYGRYDSLRMRELKYIVKKEKIILLPTTDFIDTNVKAEQEGCA